MAFFCEQLARRARLSTTLSTTTKSTYLNVTPRLAPSLRTPISCFQSSIAQQRSLSSTTQRTSLRSSLSALPSTQIPLRRGLEEFFDNANGWVWTDHELPTGRAWTREELRGKSFDDLHKLWWVCTKEVNRLRSQQVEGRRFKVHFPHDTRLKECRRTMARIKYVLWERRTAYFQAQYLYRRETKAAQLREEGVPEEEIKETIDDLFPTPVENVARRVKREPRRPYWHPKLRYDRWKLAAAESLKKMDMDWKIV
ncbi:54S ribosomal protein L4 mitochondrial [Rhizophlyctis rosea]|nr:54S ribosomal protein L4 mitochondrial [Rhizophlyctis rosea]